MKKKILISIVSVFLLLVVLFVPFSHTLYGDGGTEEWAALTYKIVKWNRLEHNRCWQDENGCIEGDECTAVEDNDWFRQTSVYWGADRFKSIDELYRDERYVDCYKPVIYLYPEAETEVSLTLTLDGELTCTYPAYENGWNVTASPDGTLTGKDGKIYNYLYWEGETNFVCDMSRGFCVKGEDTAKFLEEALAKLGLNRREANEFIVYWLPLMQDNEYNIISFQTDAYTDAALLEVTPTPDTVIRVFMAYKPTESYAETEEQELTAPERKGFTVVEWGGTEIK